MIFTARNLHLGNFPASHLCQRVTTFQGASLPAETSAVTTKYLGCPRTPKVPGTVPNHFQDSTPLFRSQGPTWKTSPRCRIPQRSNQQCITIFRFHYGVSSPKSDIMGCWPMNLTIFDATAQRQVDPSPPRVPWSSCPPPRCPRSDGTWEGRWLAALEYWGLWWAMGINGIIYIYLLTRV